MLVYLFLIVLPGCSDLTIASSGITNCELSGSAYLFGIAFVAVALYAGYRMSRILFPARFP